MPRRELRTDGTWTVEGRMTSNHRDSWEPTDAAHEGTVTELTGTIDYIDVAGVKAAVIARA